MLLSEASKQSLQPIGGAVIHVQSLVGCNDCFEASLSAVLSAPVVGFGAQRFAPTAPVRLRSERSGAPHSPNNSLERTANSIKCQDPWRMRAAAQLKR
jgi:hypothetical protein